MLASYPGSLSVVGPPGYEASDMHARHRHDLGVYREIRWWVTPDKYVPTRLPLTTTHPECRLGVFVPKVYTVDREIFA